MLTLPKDLALLERFRAVFTRPTYERFLFLCLSAIVTMGRRTVCRLLWSAQSLADGHPSSYHRFFSAARWSMLALGKVLAAMVLERVPKDQPVVMELDDSVTQHRGKKVYGKAWHRDPIRSSQSHTHMMLGHRWVSLAVNVMLPLCNRCWALPVFTALYEPLATRPGDAAGQARARQKGNQRNGKGCEPGAQKRSRLPVLRKRDKAGVLPPRHKTPCLLGRQMLALFLHWFPDRRFIVAGDGGFASHDLAWFCYRHRKRVTLIARYIPNATLYALPTTGRNRGRKRRKGALLPNPGQAVASAKTRRHATVRWYGGKTREAELISGCGIWYRARGSGRAALVPVRWVWAKELAKGQEAWFYSTDPSLTPERIVELFAGRWAIEVTFEEVRAHLGFATTRQRCRKSVLRAAPCLLGLFTLVSLIYAHLTKRQIKVGNTPCSHKLDPTFADALAAVRRVIWEQVILPRTSGHARATKWPPALRTLLLDHLTAAA
jgi:hypothetical protein